MILADPTVVGRNFGATCDFDGVMDRQAQAGPIWKYRDSGFRQAQNLTANRTLCAVNKDTVTKASALRKPSNL